MDGMLPSEVARLVLGWLEEENSEAAKILIENSELLRECYNFTQRGRRFPRTVQGFTLIELLDKYCAMNALVQERFNKMEECESLKTTADILEKLRFVMDGSRGQRFVVNINVPTQNASQASGGSPIISSSMRKRRHSGPVDRDRSKKIHKSNSPSLDGGSEPNIPQSSDTVETTSLEALPGHKDSSEAPATTKEDNRRVQCSSTSAETSPPKDTSDHMLMSTSFSEKSPEPHNLQKEPEASSQTCETGTDTKELTAFTNTEVQTAPCEGFDTASELMDCPAENLTLLTKELLNRTELQERIAETINRGLIPAEASLRDGSFTETNSGECNTSIMRELDNAIKSIVIETETDPVFEQFLLETIGQGIEGETSPDEDGVCSPTANGQLSNPPGQVPVSTVGDTPDRETREEELSRPSGSPAIIEINAEMSQSPPKDLPSTSSDPPAEKDLTALDDVNAEAILNIINVNNTSKEQNQDEVIPESQQFLNLISQTEAQVEETSAAPVDPEIIIENVIPTQADPKIKRRRSAKQRRERKRATPKKRVPESELVPVPTLVVCSQQEIASMKLPLLTPKPQFVPIMPKIPGVSMPGMSKPTDPTLYLKTVNVMRSKVPEVSSASSIHAEPIVIPETISENPQNSNEVEMISDSNTGVNESITLYGKENGAAAVMNADIPSVQMEESMSLIGTGLSPFLKLHRRPVTSTQEQNPTNDDEINKEGRRLSSQSSDLLTRRTPKSIMKSRARNHRLSLSTPRRRSSHIRALDFNTPTKGLNSSRRMSDADKSYGFSPKSSKGLSRICRTSLFKSPPFGSVPSPKKKTKTPSKINKIPIATRSPAPKLIGGWDKITGVGMIIESSSQSSFPSPEKSSPIKQSVPAQIKKTWDSDLRMAAAADVQPVETKKKEKPVKKRRSSKKEKSAEAEPMVINEDDADGVERKSDLIADSKEKPTCSLIPGDPSEKPQDVSVAKNPIPTVANEQSKPVELIQQRTESTTKIREIITERGVTKKYAKLKTLTTTVTKVEKNRRINPRTPRESLEKSSEFGRSDSSKLPDLETPRKFDPNLVPPTPRVLSPSSNMTTPFAQISEDTGKIESFVSTPEFPPTPSINLTPKQSNDSTISDTRKADFGSRYYQPTSELDDVRRKGKTGNPVTIVSSKEERVLTTKMNTETFQASTSQLEITQFEVIKENLPKDQAIKELKLSRNSETQSNKENTVNEAGTAADTPDKVSKTLESSGTADDSSESESDSSSSSSGSCSSCSCCDTTNTSSKLSTSRKSRKTPHKVDCSTNDFTQQSSVIVEKPLERIDVKESVKKIRDSSVDSSKENINSQKVNEESPVKVIPISKTEKVLQAIDLETPAKDEGLLVEANISETPSSSKAGFENVTNLNSKISAIIKEDLKPRESVAILTKKPGPTIISVEKLSPKVTLTKITDGDIQNAGKIFMDAKLARELDEKRLRIMNKLRADNAPARSRASRSKEPAKSKTEPSEPPPKSENPPKKSNKSQPLRKSMRNAEKRAKRGLSEPIERRTPEEVPPQRKAQSSRDPSADDEGNIDNIILPEMNLQINPQTAEEAIFGGDVELGSENKGEGIDRKEKEDLIVDDKKGKVKSKVDKVKRDLFSDEETTDGKSTRRLSDPQKSESLDSVESKQHNGESSDPGGLPGVLESLQLVPTNKSFEGAEAEPHFHTEISIVYDETQPREKEKRRKKYRSSELELRVQVEDSSGELVWKTLTASPYEEIFNITPPRKKRVFAPKPKIVKEKPATAVAPKRRGKIQLKNGETVVTAIKGQPLATSSPVSKEESSKPSDRTKTGARSRGEDKVVKPRKRKQSESSNKDDHVDKKPRTTDPTTLLSGLNIDKLLDQVHGSES